MSAIITEYGADFSKLVQSVSGEAQARVDGEALLKTLKEVDPRAIAFFSRGDSPDTDESIAKFVEMRSDRLGQCIGDVLLDKGVEAAVFAHDALKNASIVKRSDELGLHTTIVATLVPNLVWVAGGIVQLAAEERAQEAGFTPKHNPMDRADREAVQELAKKFGEAICDAVEMSREYRDYLNDEIAGRVQSKYEWIK